MWHYEYSRKPVKVKGGIKAHSKRGDFGQNWWSKLWEEFVYYAVYPEDNFKQGKSYARRGQVASIRVEKGIITAVVYGSSRTPYNLTIQVEELPQKKWQNLARSLFAQPAAMAELLAGRLPRGLEAALEEAKLSLVPEEYDDIEIKCGCYWGEFCKHAAAVCLLLAEEFDRDPFLLLKLRGVEREELLEMTGIHTKAVWKGSVPQFLHRLRTISGRADLETPVQGEKPRPLSMDPDGFWGRDGLKQYDPGGVGVPEVSAALPKRLGKFPLWRSKIKFVQTMEEIYKGASRAGLVLLLGEAYVEALAPAKRRRGRPRKNPA